MELGKLSVFPGGNVGGAGGKCLSDGDGLPRSRRGFSKPIRSMVKRKLRKSPPPNTRPSLNKCLSDGDGLLSVIDDVIFFHGVALLFILNFVFQEVVSLALFEISNQSPGQQR